MHVSAPGKLFLSGEWAVLETGNRGLVAAVDKKVHVEIETSNKNTIDIELKDYGARAEAEFDGNEIVFSSEVDKEKFRFTKAALESALLYLKETGKETKSFSLRTWGDETTAEINGETKKLGFGSSAAATVSIIGAVLALHGYGLNERETKDIVYKLAAIAHFFAQGKVGSAFDVAASTYGGVFVYSRFDADWLISKMESGDTVKDVVEARWPGFSVEQMNVPDDFRLIVGWTKDSASTSAMIKQMNAFRDQSAENTEAYETCFANIADVAAKAIDAWKSDDRAALLEALCENEERLAELGRTTGVDIETDDLREMSRIANEAGAAGKLSGAGGGDCGIAVCYDESTAEHVQNNWKEAGFYLVDAGLSRNGVSAE